MGHLITLRDVVGSDTSEMMSVVSSEKFGVKVRRFGDDNAIAAPTVSSKVVEALMSKQQDIQTRLQLFKQVSAAKRAQIATKFAELRATVDSSERAALVAYDSEVHAVVKRVEAEEAAAKVWCEQLAGLLFCGRGSDGEELLPSARNVEKLDNLPGFALVDCIVPQEVTKSILNDCWKVVSTLDDATQRYQHDLAAASTEHSIVKDVRTYAACIALPLSRNHGLTAIIQVAAAASVEQSRLHSHVQVLTRELKSKSRLQASPGVSWFLC
jgi:hypothetical protein